MFWNLSLKSLATNWNPSQKKGKQHNWNCSTIWWQESESDSTCNWFCLNFKFSPSLFFYNFFVLINLVIKFLLTITDILQSEILCPHHRKGRIKQHSPWKHIFERTFYLFLIISISGLNFISKPWKSMISPVSSGLKTLISGIWFLRAVMRNHMHQQSL